MATTFDQAEKNRPLKNILLEKDTMRTAPPVFREDTASHVTLAAVLHTFGETMRLFYNQVLPLLYTQSYGSREKGLPFLWETMIFGRAMTTLIIGDKAAHAGHKKAVTLVKTALNE